MDDQKQLEGAFNNLLPVETAADRERGPDVFVEMRPGQTAQLVMMGWLEGGRYDDQPVVYSRVKGHCVALPAHAILLDKLANVQRLTPIVVTCQRAGNRETQAAWRYSVSSGQPLTDAPIVEHLEKARRDFDVLIAQIRGQRRAGVRRIAAGPGLSDVPASDL